jgi:tetratricopeptide (TPR) repeat protein
MARLLVQFPGEAKVVIDGAVCGDTNRVIRLGPGEHCVELEGQATEPERHILKVAGDSDPQEVRQVGFRFAAVPIERFSPLYCRYNGFLLGQFLSLVFSSIGREKYAERRARMFEFLQEIAVDVAVPDDPVELGSGEHVDLIQQILTKTAALSNELTEFVLLGALLTHHGLLADTDAATAQQSFEQAERIRKKYDLPPLDIERFIAKGEMKDVDDVLSPSLAYLGEAVDKLEIESDTAFVIMPFKQPYSSYFSTFYRPSLEASGYRAFRAWGGLSSEDYCDLLLKLIGKAGMVWADVSELNYNVLYEIGASHALGKLSMLVVSEDVASTIPANIGHDAVMVYSPTAENWPQETVLLMSALLSALQAAAERGQKLRVGPDLVSASLELVGRQLVKLLIPPEAHEAAKNGLEKLNAGDYAGAENCFDEAIQLGLDDLRTLWGRASARLSLERYGDAEADLTRVLELEDLTKETGEAREQRRTAAFCRGMAREQQQNYAGARDDYETAIHLDYPDLEARRRRAFVNLQLQDLEAARKDVEKIRELAPEEANTHALTGDLLVAEKAYQAAIDEYDLALATEPSVDVELGRALALLMAGQLEEALKGYGHAVETAELDQINRALEDLQQKAAASPDREKCRIVLLAARKEPG